MRIGVTQETGLGCVSQQSLYHRQGDQLGIRQLWSDPHPGPLRRPLRMLNQQIICSHVQCGGKGVRSGPIPGPPRIGEDFASRILDTPGP